MATKSENSSKRKLQDDEEPQKKAKKQRKQKKAREDEEDLDVEAGLNRAFERMDGQLVADHIAQKTRRFGTDLSPVELSDLYISGKPPNELLLKWFDQPMKVLTIGPKQIRFWTPHHGKSRGLLITCRSS